MEPVILVAGAACAVGVLCAAWVTVAAHRNVDKIGNDQQLKRESLGRSLFNFYAVLVLAFIVLVRALGFIGDQAFIGFFSIIVGALGFKLTAEVFGK